MSRRPAPRATTEGPMLAVEDVVVKFGGVTAVHGLNLTAAPHEITALIGPNGAGKTTSFNVITGLETPASGRVRLAGRDVSKLSPYKRARLGLARTFQRLEVFGSLTARDNILAAAEFHAGWSDSDEDPRAVTDEIIDLVGIRHCEHDRADGLPTGFARLVELGRALATRPRVLLLDEPASGLNHDEGNELGDLLLRLADDGMAVLIVEHDVDLVMRISDLIHVLDFGKLIAVGTPADIQRNPVVQAAYLGEDTAELEEVGSL